MSNKYLTKIAEMMKEGDPDKKDSKKKDDKEKKRIKRQEL